MAQTTVRPNFFDHARISQEDLIVTVTANDPIPLFQAILALRAKYGWLISWESAPGYARFDLVDDTAPKWRAAHPDLKGVTRPSGGLFTATFSEPKDVSDSDTEHEVLTKLVEQYNLTDNPGKYAVWVYPDKQFTIVGIGIRDETGAPKNIQPLLDTPVTVSKIPRSVEETIQSVLDALQAATGKKIIFAVLSHSLFINTQATIGGEKFLHESF